MVQKQVLHVFRFKRTAKGGEIMGTQSFGVHMIISSFHWMGGERKTASSGTAFSSLFSYL